VPSQAAHHGEHLGWLRQLRGMRKYGELADLPGTRWCGRVSA